MLEKLFLNHLIKKKKNCIENYFDYKIKTKTKRNETIRQRFGLKNFLIQKLCLYYTRN
jgi:hypothetical protein